MHHRVIAVAVVLLALGGSSRWIPSTSAAAPVTPPGAFTLTSPANGATNVPLTPTLVWAASSGAATYTLEAASDSGFTNIVFSQVGITITSYKPGAPVAQGITVYWRITAVNAGGNTVASNAPFTFTTVVLPPGPFTLSAPANSATGVALQPTFSWAASTGAATYTLEVATDSGFASPVVSQSGLVATNFMPGAPLTSGTNYYWRVTAVNPGGSTLASGAPFSFQTLTTGPGTFALVYPPDQSFGVDPNTFFLWDDAAGVTSYTLDLATDAAFTNMVFEVTGIPGSSFSSTLSLAPLTTYYWRVIAVNGSGSTMGTGSPFRFETQSVSGGGGGGAVGFSGSSGGSCGLLGLEVLAPWALWIQWRRRRHG